MDLYMTDTGDIAVSSGGDFAVTDSAWRDHSQQAYLRLMTQISDFTMYPTLGADLDELIGMAQTKETGDYGIKLVEDALRRDGSFSGLPIVIKAVPMSLQGIRFDIYITAGSRTEMILSIEQNLELT